MSDSKRSPADVLKAKRAAKKGSMTRRINEITQIINDNGSRTKVTFLLKALLTVKAEAEKLDEELSSLVTEHDETWMENEKERCDTIAADVEEYLASRVGEAPSSVSLTESWVQKHSPEAEEASENQSVAMVSSAEDNHFDPSSMSNMSLSESYKYPMRPPLFTGSFSVGDPNAHREPFPNPTHLKHNTTKTSFSRSHGASAMATDTTKTPLKPEENEVDSWIDELDLRKPMRSGAPGDELGADQMMGWFVQQSLPRMAIPEFDGSPTSYIEFITKIRDLVHNQPFLRDIQRSSLLLQHLKGEAKLAVKGFSQDWVGYVLSLKKIKFLFGQRQAIARSVLTSITKGKALQDDDPGALSQFYYDVSECITTLKMLNYASDLFSTETLLQAVKRLPRRLINKWADHGLSLRQRSEEPNLMHLELWLQARVLAQREACVVETQPSKSKKYINLTKRGSGDGERTNDDGERTGNYRGEGQKLFWKCDWFKALLPKEKFERVSKEKRCFNCLNKGHITSGCSSKGTCMQKGCKKRHHTTLHEYYTSNPPTDTKEEKKDVDVEVAVEGTEGVPAAEAAPSNLMIRGNGEVYLQVVHVVLRSKSRTYRTYALIDPCSMFTLIRDSVIEVLGLTGKKGHIEFETVKEEAPEDREKIPAVKVSLTVSSLDGKNSFAIDAAYGVSLDYFNMPAQPSPVEEMNGETPAYIEGLNLTAVRPEQISILLGADVAEASLVQEVRRGEPGQPLAINTMLGWTLFGKSSRISTAGGQSRVHVNLVKDGQFVPDTDLLDSQHIDLPLERSEVAPAEDADLLDVQQTDVHLERSDVTPTEDFPKALERVSDSKLDDALEQFWMQEQSLIAPSKETAMSQEDLSALHQLESGTRKVGDRYEVPMLWRHPSVQLPDNYPLARRRFGQTIRRLRGDQELHVKYKAVMDQLVAKGFARKLTKTEVDTPGKRRCYLPHHPVTNVNKPGKVRVVNDAAAVYKGSSLNSSLVTGPDLLNPLVGVLTKFRRDPIAIGGDIEAMFHQVRTNDQDSDSLCLLWTDDIFSDNDPYVLKMLVHIFGAKDSMTCCCYALQRTARDHSHLMSPLTFETILKNFYADDLLRSVPSEEVAIELVKELMSVLKRGGFRLTKFVSNSKKVLDSIPEEDVSPRAFFNLDGELLERILGVKWDIYNDVFTFIFTVIDAASSKRGILKVTCSIFDPLGLVIPFILIAKLLLQELWRLSIDWDDELPSDLMQHWENWKAAARNITCVRLPRCFFPGGSSVTEIQLHVFGDASELAYGSVAYLRITFKDGHHEVSYVISKSKLAPLKTVTLPRLELSAAVTAIRLYRSTIHEIDLPVERTYFWTDSTLTHQYISNTKHRFKVYPANRVSEILETSCIDQWMLTPGDVNPADILTRGVRDPSQLMEPNPKGTSWFHGPAFLAKDEDEWPQLDGGILPDDDPEVKRKSVLVTLGLLFMSEHNMSEQIDATRFSSWIRLKRVAGWILRFIANAIGQKLAGDFSAEEMRKAEHFIIKGVQNTAFEEQIDCLVAGKFLTPGDTLAALSPFIDEKGCLRVGGRLRKTALPTDAKHQLILPKTHPVTNLIINHEHTSNGHIGPEHVLSNLRQQFWIVNGRVAIKSVLRKCFFCQVKHAKQMFPYMADLPESRSAYLQPPFANCGVDLFGPITIKQGRKQLKRWVALFTCLTVRCIHLEVVYSPDTDDFINALRRFTNRRGCPENMFSDCGGNFKGAVNELRDIIERHDKEKIKTFAASKGIAWSFNPPSAPHMGGVWERLVRSVKEIMTGMLLEKVLTDPQLTTLLTEVESILNSRPLTHISSDINDLEALTPNHILLGLHRKWESMMDVDKDDVTSRKHWRQVQALSIVFWERWRKEYLPELTKRSKWRGQVPNYQVGELVVLSDEQSKKKGKWSLARILRVMPGADGVVRTVELKTADGTYVRPTSKLFRLEENI